MAFNAVNMKPETIHKRASELMAQGAIKGRLGELKAQLQEVNLWSRTESVKALIESLGVAKEQNNVMAIVAVVKALNEMHGFNSPQQVQLSGAVDINKIVIETVIVPHANTDV